jgi:hypothetical protein
MEKLAAILTDMLKSALVWEQEHGVQQCCAKIEPVKPLTNVNGTYTLNGRDNAEKEGTNEHQDDLPENESS